MLNRGRPLYQTLCGQFYRIAMSRRLLSYVTNAEVKVNKDPSMADEAFDLTITGLSARQRVTLHASVRLPNTAVLESTSHYTADDIGTIQLNRDASQGGSFTGVEPMGPLSFMVPSTVNKKKYERFLIKDPTKPFTINFHVLDSFVNLLEEDIARKVHDLQPNLTVHRIYMAPGVKEVPIWEGRVRGTMYIPPGDGPFPGVISMSGGYPGAMKYKAALLAARGFVAIALKYFGEDDLPREFFTVDLDYVEEAAVLLRNHPKVDGRNGVGIIANCYGATVGFGLASVAPEGLIKCVVSTNGWFYPMGHITYKGEELTKKGAITFDNTKTPEGITQWKFRLTNDSSELLQETFKIAFPFYKRRETSYMFVVGEKDTYLPANILAPMTDELLRKSGHPNFEILYYEGAGHLIEHSYYPLASIGWTFQEPHDLGGEQPGHSIAQIDSWPKILEFARKNLTQSPTAGSKL